MRKSGRIAGKMSIIHKVSIVFSIAAFCRNLDKPVLDGIIISITPQKMRNEKEVIQMQTRREFLKKSAALLGSAAVVGSVPGLLKAQAEEIIFQELISA